MFFVRRLHETITRLSVDKPFIARWSLERTDEFIIFDEKEFAFEMNIRLESLKKNFTDHHFYRVQSSEFPDDVQVRRCSTPNNDFDRNDPSKTAMIRTSAQLLAENPSRTVEDYLGEHYGPQPWKWHTRRNTLKRDISSLLIASACVGAHSKRRK
jgi:hypothetical protein